MTAAPRYRFYVVVVVLVLLTCVVAGRITYLKLFDAAFLGDQGDRRSVRHIAIPVTRGMITDRNGAPLAVSTEVVTIWCNPSEMQDSADQLGRLAQAIHKPEAELRNLILGHPEKHFLYLARALSPIDGENIMALGVPGVRQIKEYKRYYPSSDLVAQVIGMVNIDGHGQEGLELGFEDWLAGRGGVREVLINPRGSVVKNIRVVRQPQPSKDVALSIDLRLQFIAYRALQTAVEKFGAQSGKAEDGGGDEARPRQRQHHVEEGIQGTGSEGRRRFQRARTDGLEGVLQRLHHEGQRIAQRTHHQPGEGEGQPPQPQRLRQLPYPALRPHGQQQVEADHRGRQHQRQGHQGADRPLEPGAGARQPPGEGRTQHQEQQGGHAGQFQGQADRRPVRRAQAHGVTAGSRRP